MCNSGRRPSRRRSGDSAAASRCRPAGSGSTWTARSTPVRHHRAPGGGGPTTGRGGPDRAGSGRAGGRRAAGHGVGAVRWQQPTLGPVRRPGRGADPVWSRPVPRRWMSRSAAAMSVSAPPRSTPRSPPPGTGCGRRSPRSRDEHDPDLAVSIALTAGSRSGTGRAVPGDGAADHQPQPRPPPRTCHRTWSPTCTGRQRRWARRCS